MRVWFRVGVGWSLAVRFSALMGLVVGWGHAGGSLLVMVWVCQATKSACCGAGFASIQIGRGIN